jgi:hypothetical protein
LPPAVTYADFGAQVVSALTQDLWAGGGLWYECDGGCAATNQDWGADSLTYVLFLRWLTTHDPTLAPYFESLVATAHAYPGCRGAMCADWSDVPEWDAVADEREYEVTGQKQALALAQAAYEQVAESDAYALGACPKVRYQRPFGGGGGLKTLETDSNAIKAALLLYRATNTGRYLDDARSLYAAVRAVFFDPNAALYTAYVFDDGHACTQLPHRFFASVNGNMIWNGIELSSATGDAQYLADAQATAGAVRGQLADTDGIFANLQADNDVAEPLVEGMFLLATSQGDAGALAWLRANAQAAVQNARIPDGLYARFWDGPAPDAAIDAWQTNGGMALAVTAAALWPTEMPRQDSAWSGAQRVRIDVSGLPVSYTFSGSGIAVVGTLGDSCCEPGRAALHVDGVEPTDHTGIWQNKSPAGESFPGAVLFAWRWPTAGPHRLDFLSDAPNAKEGGPFLHVTGYLILP